MFKFIKNFFSRPRLIERYESMADIIDAHNKLIVKTSDVSEDMSPAYLCFRINAIQDSEKRAIAAYWKNKKRKHDIWRKKSATPAIVADTQADKATNPQPLQMAAMPLLTALKGNAQTDIAVTEPLQAIETPKEADKNVIEIHINK